MLWEREAGKSKYIGLLYSPRFITGISISVIYYYDGPCLTLVLVSKIYISHNKKVKHLYIQIYREDIIYTSSVDI